MESRLAISHVLSGSLCVVVTMDESALSGVNGAISGAAIAYELGRDRLFVNDVLRVLDIGVSSSGSREFCACHRISRSPHDHTYITASLSAARMLDAMLVEMLPAIVRCCPNVEHLHVHCHSQAGLFLSELRPILLGWHNLKTLDLSRCVMDPTLQPLIAMFCM